MNSNTTNNQSRESSTAFDAPTYEISYGVDHTLQWDPPQGSKELAVALSYHFPLERDLESKMRAATQKFLKAEAKKKKMVLGWNAVVSKAKAVLGRTKRVEEEDSPAIASTLEFQTTVLAPVKENQRAGQKATDGTKRSILEKPSSAASITRDDSQPFVLEDSPAIMPIEPSDRVSQPRTSSSRPLQILNWDPHENRFMKRKKRRYGKEEGSKVAANRGNACADHQRKKNEEICPQNKQNLRNGCSPHRNAISQASMPEDGRNLQEATTIETSLRSSSSTMPNVNMTKSSGIESVLNGESDLASPTFHRPISRHGFADKRAVQLVSIQAPIIPGDPSLSEFWTDSWGYDPSFFSLPEVNHRSLNQAENAENSPTQGFGPFLSENGVALDCPSVNNEDSGIGSKSHLGDDRPLSKAQVDRQDPSQFRNTLQSDPWDNSYNFDIDFDPAYTVAGGSISPDLFGCVPPLGNYSFPVAVSPPLPPMVGSKLPETQTNLSKYSQSSVNIPSHVDGFELHMVGNARMLPRDRSTKKVPSTTLPESTPAISATSSSESAMKEQHGRNRPFATLKGNKFSYRRSSSSFRRRSSPHSGEPLGEERPH